ncbi:MAG: 2-oxoacid ferredoxin oxidoreductase [Candidatus Levybacteria bacterium]|nr:2-oxoacid ferredoxin oxidoreductase [Candidatus Levybacteria bacterium]
MLLLRQGILPTITVNKAYSIHKVSYSIQVIDPHDFSLLQTFLNGNSDKVTDRSRSLITKDFAFLPIKKIETKPYRGPVHNFEVDTENAYVTENAILHNCGDFGIWVSLKNAIVQLELNPWEVVLVSGIGCSSKLPYWVKTYGFNGLHGRPMPVAEGIRLANHGLKVIVIGGDGDQYGEGGNHLMHAARRNVDLTLLIHNNQIYGLTTGQYSPTTSIGDKNKATPVPVTEAPVNPMSLGLAAGATFVARGFSGDNKQETQLLVEAVKHKGFAMVDTMQPCVTFNHHNTFSWFYERVYKLEEAGHDPKDKIQAFARAEEWPLRRALKEGEKEKVATGIFYREERPTWEDGMPQIATSPLVRQPIDKVDINPLFDELM